MPSFLANSALDIEGLDFISSVSFIMFGSLWITSGSLCVSGIAICMSDRLWVVFWGVSDCFYNFFRHILFRHIPEVLYHKTLSAKTFPVAFSEVFSDTFSEVFHPENTLFQRFIHILSQSLFRSIPQAPSFEKFAKSLLNPQTYGAL